MNRSLRLLSSLAFLSALSGGALYAQSPSGCLPPGLIDHSPAGLLSRRAQLGLTDEQVSRLEALHDDQQKLEDQALSVLSPDQSDRLNRIDSSVNGGTMGATPGGVMGAPPGGCSDNLQGPGQ